MHKPPSIDLGSVKIPADASLDAPFNEPSFTRRATKQALRHALADFTTAELKGELLDRDVTDFSRITPWLKCALLIVIAAAVLMGYWGTKCADGEMFGFVCAISQ